jgi:hypothetical protein
MARYINKLPASNTACDLTSCASVKNRFQRHAEWKLLTLVLLFSIGTFTVVSLLVWILHERARHISLAPATDTIERHHPTNQEYFFTDPDTCYWVLYAEQMLKQNAWRVRWTNADNAPYGREVHWSSLPIWWLLFLYQFFPGTMAFRLKWAAYLSNPLLLLLSILPIVLVVYRRFGPQCAIIICLTIFGSPSVYWAFYPTSAGHHGLQFLSAFGTIFAIVAANFGYLKCDSANSTAVSSKRARNRVWFFVSGLSTGFGLWFGVPNTILTMIPVVIIAIVLSSASRSRSQYFQPECWWLWALTASGSSCLFYLVEYWPHLPMRLEVNHPFYSISLLVTGFFVPGIRRIWIKRSLVSCLEVAIPLIILALVLATVLFGPSDWFYLRDPDMLRLHRTIEEFRPLLDSGAAPALAALCSCFGVALVASIIGTGVLFLRRRWSYLEAFFVGSLISSLILAVITLVQRRWHLFFCTASIPLLISSYQLCFETPFRAKLTFLLSATVMVQAIYCMLALMLFNSYQLLTNGLPLNADQALVSRELARLVEQAQGSNADSPPIVLTGPNEAPFFAIYGAKAIGSLYWENLAGVKTHYRIFENSDLEAIRDLLKSRQAGFLTVAYLPSKEESLSKMCHSGQQAYSKCFEEFLETRDPILPTWLHLLETEKVRLESKEIEFRVYRIDK